jgi:Ca2+-binding EF-hand superfamily protein
MGKRFFSFLFAAAMLVALSGLPASAQESQAGNADKAFASLDSNKDGKLSQAEFGRLFEMEGNASASPQQKQEEFKAWDADGDGSVSKAEFTAKYGK